MLRREGCVPPLEASVERSTRECSLHGELNVVKSALRDKSSYGLEGLGAGPIETQNEASVHANAAILNPAYRLKIGLNLSWPSSSSSVRPCIQFRECHKF